jgi:hypothetical protein
MKASGTAKRIRGDVLQGMCTQVETNCAVLNGSLVRPPIEWRPLVKNQLPQSGIAPFVIVQVELPPHATI